MEWPLPKGLETSCTWCLATWATFSRKDEKRKVQEGALDKMNVPSILLSDTADGSDNQKKQTRLTHTDKLSWFKLDGQRLQIPGINGRFCCSERTIYLLIICHRRRPRHPGIVNPAEIVRGGTNETTLELELCRTQRVLGLV